MSINRQQTLPSITLRYASDEVTGDMTWMLVVSDGDERAEAVKVSPETAAGIAQTVDVALPLPIMLSGEPTSAERVVRAAHVQTLAAQLAAAEAELRATAPAKSTTVPREPAAPRLEVAHEPAARPARGRRPAAAKVTETPRAAAPASVEKPSATTHDEEPDLGEPLTEEPPMPDLAPAEPPRYTDVPEVLPRRSHLSVPPVEEF
jgi:hypothetical protein